MKTSAGNGKISNQTTMGERLERIGDVCIVDGTDCFRLGFIEKMGEDLGAPPKIWEQYSREGRI